MKEEIKCGTCRHFKFSTAGGRCEAPLPEWVGHQPMLYREDQYDCPAHSSHSERLHNELREARTDLMLCADNARDAAKTDPRWEGVADNLMARVAECDKALEASS